MRDIELLHPKLRPICRAFVEACAAEGLKVGIADTFRTKAEQDALYAQGRTKPGSIVTNAKYPKSPHNWGVAFDFYRNDGKGAYYNANGFFRKAGQIGKRLGLFWGGDFRSFVDQPHLELPEFLPNNSANTLIAKYGTPEAFIKTWEEEEPVTYEQFVEFMKRYEAEKAAMPATWEADVMDAAKAAGIINDGRPKSNITRGEMAQVLKNAGII